MCRLRFKKQSRPFPPHIVSGEKIWPMWVEICYNLHSYKVKRKQSHARRNSAQTKQVHSDTNCAQEKQLGHHATELQPHRMCTLTAHRPASARFKKALFIKVGGRFKTEMSRPPPPHHIFSWPQLPCQQRFPYTCPSILHRSGWFKDQTVQWSVSFKVIAVLKNKQSTWRFEGSPQ